MVVKVLGNAVVVESAVKFEDIKLVKKYRPSALTLIGADGKEPVFAVAVTDSIGKGSINTNGIVFDSQARETGNAYVTMSIMTEPADVKGYIADAIGSALISLQKIEPAITAAVEEIAGEKAAVLEGITIVQ